MDLNYTPAQQAFRAEVRDWLSKNVPAEPFASYDTREGFNQHRQWEAKLAEAGWSSVTWPTELGGRGSDFIEWLIFEEEYWAVDAPMRVNQNGILLLGPTLMEFGTPEQKARFLPATARCDAMWAQGWSEPNAGSDMAAISSRALRVSDGDGDHYVLNGQKTWSTRAIFANWLFGLFRSDPASSRHRGLSYLLVPLDAPGITIRPIQALNGKQAFAEVFFDDVRVPVENRIGGEGQGWNVAMATAGFERGLLLRSPARYQRTAQKLVQLYRQHQVEADRDPSIRESVLRAWMGAEAYTLASYHVVGRLLKGATIGAEASTNKIFWSELDLQMHETAMRILGPRAELRDDPEVHDWLEGFLFAQAGSIYAGSNEIQRNIIAERLLGLPKS
ncbi:acyl-CoA dehydrogenase family protein [Pseudorhodoferax sp.]|jgi:alkylation response protein AidB-like acyl-CoA dehydrogenase|uniref:acyl-CoA dehydrogenase family protein n=1 Tax=Pseudorhodoferax sp. TaxID=1993553 RepID=UPI002DD6B9EC|nr:acyl-CoA dehydrogenase family protein [Pseudorhodoferax sp.]